MSIRSRLAWVIAFAVAFGWFEGAVVVYLRELAYPGGFAFPVAPLPPRVLRTEIVREVASLVVMVAAAALAGTNTIARVAAFFTIFGVWDLVYYVTLWLVLGWPASLATLDVLFLIPTAWVGPVWAPSLVAVVFVVGGAYVFLTPGVVRAYRRRDWLFEIGAGLAIAISFMDDAASLEAASPEAFTPVLYWTGLVLGVGYFLFVEARQRTPLAARVPGADAPSRGPQATS